MKMNSMTTGRAIRSSVPFAVTLAAALGGAGACGGEPSDGPADESVSVETSAFSTSGCASVTADAFIYHPQFIEVGAPPTYPGTLSVTSPTTYNNCGKGYVVDIIHADGAAGLPDFNWHKEVKVTWNGPITLTRAACEDMEGSAIIYDNFGAGWVNPSRISVTGQWIGTAPFQYCSTPKMTFTAYRADKTRVAATMRYMSGSNPTVSVKVSVRTTSQGQWCQDSGGPGFCDPF
jgi:hypothetical protein